MDAHIRSQPIVERVLRSEEKKISTIKTHTLKRTSISAGSGTTATGAAQ